MHFYFMQTRGTLKWHQMLFRCPNLSAATVALVSERRYGSTGPASAATGVYSLELCMSYDGPAYQKLRLKRRNF